MSTSSLQEIKLTLLLWHVCQLLASWFLWWLYLIVKLQNWLEVRFKELFMGYLHLFYEWFDRHSIDYAPCAHPLLLFWTLFPLWASLSVRHVRKVSLCSVYHHIWHISFNPSIWCFHSLKPIGMKHVISIIMTGRIVIIYQFSQLFATAWQQAIHDPCNNCWWV